MSGENFKYNFYIQNIASSNRNCLNIDLDKCTQVSDGSDTMANWTCDIKRKWDTTV